MNVSPLLLYAAVPVSSFPAVLLIAGEAENPYIALGVAGTLLGVIVVPTFRWLMARVDRQQEQQEKLIAALQESVNQSAGWQSESRDLHRQLLSHAESTNRLLTAIHANAAKDRGS